MCRVNQCNRSDQRGIIPNIGPRRIVRLCNEHAYQLFRTRLTLDNGQIIEGVQFFGDNSTLSRDP